MKITRIDTFRYWVDWCNWLFVRISTDEGLVGWGEASLHGAVESVETAIREYAPHLVGQDPAGPERHWHRLYHAWRWRGGAVFSTALSALDIALWDLEGKRLGVPVARLLGGALPHVASRLREPLAAAAPRRRRTRSTARAKRRAAASPHSSAGRSSHEGLLANEAGEIRRAAALMEAAREGLGPDGEIFIECSEFLSPRTAVLLDEALHPFRPGWFEEPIPFENAKAMAQLQRDLRTPIATGERLLSRFEYRELLESGGCRIIQPDLMHAGGFTEIRKIAALADMYYVPVAPHNPGGPDLHGGGDAPCRRDPEFPHPRADGAAARVPRPRVERPASASSKDISCCRRARGSGSSRTSTCCRKWHPARSRAPSGRARSTGNCIATEDSHARHHPPDRRRRRLLRDGRGRCPAADRLQWQTANLTESQYEPVWKATIAEFEAANPGIKVEPVLVARKDHWTKFVAAAQAKKAPCIVSVDLTTAAYNGYLLPLDKYFAAEPADFRRAWSDDMLSASKWKGQLYGLPIWGGTYARNLQPRPRDEGRPRPRQAAQDVGRVPRMGEEADRQRRVGDGVLGGKTDTTTRVLLIVDLVERRRGVQRRHDRGDVRQEPEEPRGDQVLPRPVPPRTRWRPPRRRRPTISSRRTSSRRARSRRCATRTGRSPRSTATTPR